MADKKKFIVECNSKMYEMIDEAVEYFKTLKNAANAFQDAIELVVCVPFTVLHRSPMNASISVLSRAVQTGRSFLIFVKERTSCIKNPYSSAYQ